MPRSIRLLPALATVAAILAPFEPTSAQSTGDRAELDEIVVTARRREEALQNVPVSVSAFSEDAIERNMFRGVSDYLARAPAVSFSSTGARDRKQISIRGISNYLQVDGTFGVATFGFYIDDFNVSSGTVNPQIMDIERIEVLRGPQGTYFGRNSVGGAINIITNKPDLSSFYAESTLGVSSFNTYEIEGILNAPLVDEVLAIRGNVKYRESDGNISNVHPLGGGNDSEDSYGKIAVRYAPTDRLTFDFSGSYTKQRVGMREGVPSGVFADFSAGLYSGIVGPGVTPSPDGVGFFPENTDEVNFNRPQVIGTDFYILNGRVNYDFDRFSIRSITGYIDSEQHLQGDIDGGSIDFFYENDPVWRDSFSQEIRFQSIGNWKVDWTVGAIVSQDDASSRSRTYAGFARPFGVPEGTVVTAGFADEDYDWNSRAVFGEVVWHVTDRLDVTAGARYTYEDAEIAASTAQGDESVAQGTTFNDISPKLTLSYQFDDDMMGFMTVSKGFKSGGIQFGTQFGSSTYESEILWNYEAGMKSELFDNRLRLNATVFYMDWEDIQAEFNEGVLIDGELQFFHGIQNAASARSYGLEADLTALVTDNLIVNAGFGYVNAKFIEFENAFVENATHDLSGRNLPGAPEWTANADAEYGFRLMDLDWFSRLEWFYRGESEPDLRSLVNDGFPWDVPSFNHVNLRLGVEAERFSVVAYVENLLDETYYTNAYEKVFWGGVHLEPSKQVFGISLNFRTE